MLEQIRIKKNDKINTCLNGNEWRHGPAIVLTLALPVALDQGYFRYNPYILPILGLIAVLLYLGLAVTSGTCKK